MDSPEPSWAPLWSRQMEIPTNDLNAINSQHLQFVAAGKGSQHPTVKSDPRDTNRAQAGNKKEGTQHKASGVSSS